MNVQKFLLGFILLGLQTINADSGSVALAYPLTDITNDGQFSDWPENAIRYPLSRYNGNFYSEGPLDLSGNFRMGYNKAK